MKRTRFHPYPTMAVEQPEAAAVRISPLRSFLGLILMAAAACSTGMEARTSESPVPVVADSSAAPTPFLLPEHPPDSIPADAWEDDPYWRAPLDVFAVTFRPGLTREEKTRLVVDVGAIDLVGGAPFSDDTWYDGIYLIRIHDDGTMTPLRKAIDALNENPDVIAAFMLTTMG